MTHVFHYQHYAKHNNRKGLYLQAQRKVLAVLKRETHSTADSRHVKIQEILAQLRMMHIRFTILRMPWNLNYSDVDDF